MLNATASTVIEPGYLHQTKSFEVGQKLKVSLKLQTDP